MPSIRITSGVTAAAAVLSTAALLAGCGGGGTPSNTPPPHTSKPTTSPSTTSSLSGLTPVQILTKALAAADAAGSVHFSAVIRSSSVGSTDDQYASSDSGTQVTSYTNGAKATFVLVNGVGYLDANAAALAELFAGKKVAPLVGRWIATHPGNPGYEDITDGMTLASALTEFTPTGTLTSTGPQTVDGKAVIGVKGVAPANIGVPQDQPAILYVMATGQPLPVSFQAGAGADQETATFSQWGVTEHPVAPANPLPITSVMG
jgi:hypothetical protein